MPRILGATGGERYGEASVVRLGVSLLGNTVEPDDRRGKSFQNISRESNAGVTTNASAQ